MVITSIFGSANSYFLLTTYISSFELLFFCPWTWVIIMPLVLVVWANLWSMSLEHTSLFWHKISRFGTSKLEILCSFYVTGAAFAKLVAQKTKGMPRISISLSKLVGSSSIEANANLSLGLFKAFKSTENLLIRGCFLFSSCVDWSFLCQLIYLLMHFKSLILFFVLLLPLGS